jgi:yersiniabactin synthetase, thioesterase component
VYNSELEIPHLSPILMNQPSAPGMLLPLSNSSEAANRTLVLCPFAGASRGAFRSWKNRHYPGLETSLVIYPGRDHRVREPFVDSISRLASLLVDELVKLPATREPWILAGHSMGAQVAFETCLLLERRRMAPACLVLSGCQAPHLPARRVMSHLDDRAFVEQLIQVGGSPREMQSDPVFQQIFLPLLRSDFRATESYRREFQESHPRLLTPTLLLFGTRDEEAHREEVKAWELWLNGPHALRSIEGDHFYLVQDPHSFINPVVEFLAVHSSVADAASQKL